MGCELRRFECERPADVDAARDGSEIVVGTPINFGRAGGPWISRFFRSARKEFADVCDGRRYVRTATIAACGESFVEGLRGANVAGSEEKDEAGERAGVRGLAAHA